MAVTFVTRCKNYDSIPLTVIPFVLPFSSAMDMPRIHRLWTPNNAIQPTIRHNWKRLGECDSCYSIRPKNHSIITMTHFVFSSNTETSFQPIVSEQFVSFTTSLPDPLIPLNARSLVTIVLWVSPHEFYVHLRSHADQFDEMMKQMQLFYKGRASAKQRPAIGNLCIINDRKERTLKRCRVVDFNQQLGKYRVQSLDYGNKIVCEPSDVFDVEKTFTRLPPLAIRCSLPHIVANYTAAEIVERIDKYIEPTRKIQCEFIMSVDGVTYVELEVDRVNLKQTLVAESIVSLLPARESYEKLL